MKDTSNCIEIENERIEKLNNSHFWLRDRTEEGLERQVFAYTPYDRIGHRDLKKITRLQALCEHENKTEFSKQALEKLGVK
jgi:hypothetical protein